MSKAFTKESDGGDDDDEVSLPALPQGTRNYMTPEGYARLRAEFVELIDTERPKIVEIVSWAAKNGDRSETATTCTARSACARSTAACAS